MISIKSFNVHIGHSRSVGVCFRKRSQIYLFPPFPVGRDSFLVLVFAAMRNEMALRSLLLI